MSFKKVEAKNIEMMRAEKILSTQMQPIWQPWSILAAVWNFFPFIRQLTGFTSSAISAAVKFDL